MYKLVAYFSGNGGKGFQSWHIVIGAYETEKQAYKAMLDYNRKHGNNPYFQYYQIESNQGEG